MKNTTNWMSPAPETLRALIKNYALFVQKFHVSMSKHHCFCYLPPGLFVSRMKLLNLASLLAHGLLLSTFAALTVAERATVGFVRDGSAAMAGSDVVQVSGGKVKGDEGNSFLKVIKVSFYLSIVYLQKYSLLMSHSSLPIEHVQQDSRLRQQEPSCKTGSSSVHW